MTNNRPPVSEKKDSSEIDCIDRCDVAEYVVPSTLLDIVFHLWKSLPPKKG